MIRVELLTELLRHRHAVVLGARHGHGGGMGLSVARRWHRDGNDGHGRRAYDGDAACVEPDICVGDLRHMVGDDGSDDAADRVSPPFRMDISSRHCGR